ncbi:MAG: ABC transporter permease [Planctomycetota bacterium]|jgi:ABC-2 type transport system permease protein
MMDVLTMMWKEWKELFRLRGTLKGGTIGVLVFLCVFGILLPLQMGRQWVETPMLLVLWIWVPLFLVSSVVADAFAGERERHTLETLLASRLSDFSILLGKITAAIGYGWGLTLFSLLLGTVTVNLADWQGRFIFFSPVMCAGIFLWSFLAACLTACIGVLISLKATTVRQAQQIMSIAIMLILFVPIFGFKALPQVWKDALQEKLAQWTLSQIVFCVTGILAGLTLLFLLIAARKFRRARLILD